MALKKVKQHDSSQTRPERPKIDNAANLLKREFAPIRWAIRDLLPAGVSILVGAPKIGKSWLALQFALAICQGSSVWPRRPPEKPGEVLMLALEDNDRRIQTRVRKLARVTGSDVDGIHPLNQLHFATEWAPMDKGGLDRLREFLSEHRSTRLVIIDTLGRFRPRDAGSSSAYARDYEIGAQLKPIADKFDVAIMLVHHDRKQGSDDVLETISGTQGLAGSVDALLMLRRERGRMDAALYVTGRDIEKEEDYALDFDSRSCTWSHVGNVHEVQRSRQREQILTFLKENGPSSPNEIATGLNKKGSTTRRMLQNLLKAGDVSSESGRYSLPHSVMNSVNSVNGGVGVNDVTGVHDVHGVHADTEVLPPAGEEEVFDL